MKYNVYLMASSFITYAKPVHTKGKILNRVVSLVVCAVAALGKGQKSNVICLRLDSDSICSSFAELIDFYSSDPHAGQVEGPLTK